MVRFSILTWNIQGRHYYGYTPFSKIAPLLEETRADIICLQEFPQAHAALQATRFDERYKVIIPPHNERDGGVVNHNVSFSRFPIKQHGELDLTKPAQMPWWEKNVWFDVVLPGAILRVYNCHFGLKRLGISHRLAFLDEVFRHAARHKGPVIVCGDMNTVIPPRGFLRSGIRWFNSIPKSTFYVDDQYFPGDERHIFRQRAKAAGYTDPTPIDANTWRLPKKPFGILRLKLDWILVRGLKTEPAQFGKIVSDHRWVQATCILDSESHSASPAK